MAPHGSQALHVRGRTLPSEERIEYWIVDGTISAEPVADAETVFDGWILPGLVDAHCHIGIGRDGPVDHGEALRQSEAERAAGVLLLRDAGSPINTRPFDDREDLPRIVRAGRHLARTKRYIPGLPINVDEESRLPDAIAEQAQRSDGWVKLVGDWIDRRIGDLAPLWSDEILKAAISTAHAHGARVTAHVFGEEALPGLINAGIDCIEHGTGITDEIIPLMLANGTALVPTLINIDNFPLIADAATKYPAYATHMRALHTTSSRRIAAAHEAGVPVYAGTDAGGMVRHGRIADEVEAFKQLGLNPTEALGAACWKARRWLRRPGLDPGAPADLLGFLNDPRSGPKALRPELVMLGGRIY